MVGARTAHYAATTTAPHDRIHVYRIHIHIYRIAPRRPSTPAPHVHATTRGPYPLGL
ncbi:hypothetical protein OK074_7389 [Actinobacteria bacterium OK074]|nr:hypothetical protein OK074_7389 [Actinobacteria bacterium OK074]